LRTGTGSSINTVNVGSNSPGVGGNVDSIAGRLNVVGQSSNDAVFVDDTGDGSINVGVLTSSELTGLDMAAGIGYSGLQTLTVRLGTGNDTVNVQSTSASAVTTVATGAGTDTLNIGSAAPGILGTLNGIAGRLIIDGQAGSDTANLYDTSDSASNTGRLTSTEISGLGLGLGIQYAALETLNVNLGSGADFFTIDGTHTGATNLYTNDKNDEVTINTASGTVLVDTGLLDDTIFVNDTDATSTLTLHGQGGIDTFNIRGMGGSVNVHGDGDNDTINVSDTGPFVPAAGPATRVGSIGNIDGLLVVDGGTGVDVMNVDDSRAASNNSKTGTLTGTRLSGLDMPLGINYVGLDELNIWLGIAGNVFVVDGTHASIIGGLATTTVSTGDGVDLITINDVSDTLTVNGQGGDDLITINGVSDTLTVNGQGGDDDFNINGTGVGSTSNLNGDDGEDEFHVRGMGGQVLVKGGNDNDTIYVSNTIETLPASTPALPDQTPETSRTVAEGSVDDIDALLNVDGNGGSDRMFVDGSNTSTPGHNATLTANTLNGMGLSADGIIYDGLDFLTIWMDAGANTMTINGTHTTTTSIYMADGEDTLEINNANGIGGIVNIYGEQAADIFNVRNTALNSTLNLFGHEGVDTFNVSDDPTPTVLPDGDYPVGAGPPESGTFAATPLVAETFGTVDGIQGFVDIYGGTGAGTEIDQLNVDDSANLNPKRGTLTSSTLRGMNMPDGVDYHDIEDLNLWLGTNSDILFIDSTHAGTTQVYGGDGITGTADNDTGEPNRDDTIAINTIAGVTTVYGQGGNDLILVNVEEETTGGAFVRTHENGVSTADLNLTGNGGSDEYVINLSGVDTALINVHDYGTPNDGADKLTINGADDPAATLGDNDDTFLLRKDFVALLNMSDGSAVFDQVERVNYDQNINARLIVNGLAGDDTFVADDNSSITTLDGGAGVDSFQIGQIFGTQRDAAAGVAPGDEFTTTGVIVGVITNPDPNPDIDSDLYGYALDEVIFDPTLFSVGGDELDTDTVLAIQAAIDYQNGQVDANGDPDPQPLAGVAYLSDGVSFATTVYGGSEDDVFSVYRNVGTLRLEGEANDDTFIVRAFVTIDINAEQQAETEINGGLDKDFIQYAINAPVSIDGGDGFDTVIVLGTPFGDDFVVSEGGIFGAGLNVRFENIESAILDTLEGDDRIYVLGTKAGVITTVIGGLGDDLIEVAGDVDPDATIYSNDLAGRAGVIEHSFTSGDPDFATAGVNGIAVNVRGASPDDAVVISPTGAPLTVTEEGTIASYMISVINPAVGDIGTTPVYLTISAGMVSTSDRELDGDSILISLAPNGDYSKSLVLTFDGSGSLTRTIYVKAIDDNAEEGERIALISHSINSAHPDFEDLPLVDIFVNVIDDDKPGIAITEINTDVVFGTIGDVDGLTEVLEGGFTDRYQVALTKQPASGETVTVHLFTDAQINLSSSTLVFDEDNWNEAKLVTVTATANDGKDGNTLSTIRHTITTSGGAYASIGDDETVGLLDVTVYDRESAGAIIRQSDGSTEVVGAASDSYFVRLTKAPTANVTLTPTTDGQTLVSPETVPFTTGNWDEWVEVVVSANPSAPTSTDAVKLFETSGQNLNRIQGPLIVEGGVGDSVDQALQPALVLPGESNDAPEANIVPTEESDNLDVLNIFHTDNSDQDVGHLFYRDSAINPSSGLLAGIVNSGLALTGFEMAGARLAGSAGSEQLFGGGITINDIEIVEILLGKGDETLTIDDTLDDAITVVHGGGGNDFITITNRGNGPLVIYGDTSEDRMRYSNDQGGASVHGSSFVNDGIDTIDASEMIEQGDIYVGVVIYGGRGDDIIDGSDDDDHIAGGTGGDTIRANGGNDHVYGDSHFNVDPMLFAQDRLTRFDVDEPEVADMFVVSDRTLGDDLDPVNVIEQAGMDSIEGGDGADIIFGDHGMIDLLLGTRRIETTANVQNVITTLPGIGAKDTIYGDVKDVEAGIDDGDLIFGGQAGDIIDAGEGDNVVFGDHGNVDYGPDLGDIETLESLVTTLHGGADDITTGYGDDIVIGGRLGDTIVSAGGNNIVVGDSGEVIPSTTNDDHRRGSLPLTQITVSVIDTIEPTDGGNDNITTGAGADIVLGGQADDTIRSGGGADIVLGDNGTLSYELDALGDPSTLDRIESTDLTIGGIDFVFGEAGDDVLIGGVNNDLLDGGADSDLIFGDAVTLDDLVSDVNSDRFQVLQGQILYGRSEVPAFLQGIDTAPSGNDSGQVLVDGIALSYRNPDGGVPAWAEYTIADLHHSDVIETMGAAVGGFGNDYIAGGAGHDMIFGQLGDDVIQGDGSIVSADPEATDPVRVGAERVESGTTQVSPSLGAVTAYVLDITPSFDDALTDGDDYIEGNGGSDVIFGNLGQDDIVGGSSDMFSLVAADPEVSAGLRPDVDDILFGGSGTRIGHNETVDSSDAIFPAVHARDADVIAGDNANIYRIVGTGDITLPGETTPTAGTGDTGGFLSFAYDAARGGSELIRVRAVELLDYTEGGSDFDADSAATDIGAADEIHGESGDDFIYGMVGNDVLFGDSESDDIVGGYGADWVSGGQGMDGVIGDDGRIYTGRYEAFVGSGNSTVDPTLTTDYAELLNGILQVDELDKEISTPGNIQEAIINPSENPDADAADKLGEIFKTVDITPYNLDPGSLQNREFEPALANDIIFGGLGNDFLHGAAGDDAMSGAEALPEYFNAPYNPGDVLRFNEDKIEFEDYDEEFPRRELADFVLNFDTYVGPGASDAVNDNFDEDVLFGDLGNDWLVGGPDNDQLFGGFGADLMDADDDKGTNPNPDENDLGENDAPDPINIDIQDLVYGGGGRDVLIANTGGDRLMDWVGEFNSFIAPFAPFGGFTVSRAPTPHAFTFLYELSASLGADQSRAVDSGNTTNPERNGEPDGELGLVTQKDSQWQDQTGAPIDPQPGNIPGGPRLTLRGVDFNSGTTEAFAVDQGEFQAVQGRLEVSSTNLGETATAVFHVGEYLPHYYEITATISTGKPTGGLKANSYIIFDYVSPTDFKFAGINISTDKLEMGYVDESGWHELVQIPAKLKHSTDYDVLLAINGLTATLVVDNKDVLTFTYDARVDSDGFSYGLNYGLVGLGGISSVARIDNMIVQKLSPEITFEATETFAAGAAGFTPTSGSWTHAPGIYSGINVLPDVEAISLFDLKVDPNSYLELEVTVSPDTLGGVVFDHYEDGTYKFAGVLADTDQVVIGHVGRAGTIVYDTVADITFNLPTSDEYSLRVSLSGSTVSVAVLGGNGAKQTWYEVVGHAFNAVTVDGQAGLLSVSGESTIDYFAIRTDDPAFISAGDELLAPSLSLETDVPTLDAAAIQPLLDEAIRRMTEEFALDSAQQAELAAAEVTVADLPGLVLARNNGMQIEIDTDAAGHGWFVDATPSDDSEFDANGLALSGSESDGDIDLLTALMHELGHVLGFEHDDSTIMAASLTTGVRSVDLNDDGAEGPLNGHVAALWVADRQVETDNTNAGSADVRPAAMVVGERRADQRFILAAYKWRPTLYDGDRSGQIEFRHAFGHTSLDR
jgi:Ca2+-binding RTX toxin-like protein